jgi:hypothetical protein
MMQEEEFDSFEDCRAALEARLEDVAPMMGIAPPSAGPAQKDNIDDDEYE